MKANNKITYSLAIVFAIVLFFNSAFYNRCVVKAAGRTINCEETANDNEILAEVDDEIEDNKILVEMIEIIQTTPILAAKSSTQLIANIYPLNATDQTLIWKSSNENYATVDENGIVTGCVAGIGRNVTITAIANDGSGISASYDLSIIPVLVNSILITGPSDTVVAGTSIQLSVQVSPDDATEKTLTWSSSNTEYAIVYETGYVKTFTDAAGQTVTITASTSDGSKISTSYVLNIVAKIPVSSTVPGHSGDSTIPNDNGNSNGSTTSSDSSNSNSSTTPDNSGTPVVPGETSVKVTDIQINSKATAVKAGKKLKLNAIVTPSNATNSVVTWSSDNEKYATVDKNGTVKTKKTGLGKTVTITAEAQDGSGVKTVYRIKIVKATVTKIKITAGSKTVKAGDKMILKAIVKPKNVTTKKVSWSSSNKKYATVNAKGVVKTKKAGKGKRVTITATAKDGSGKKATITIKIK